MSFISAFKIQGSVACISNTLPFIFIRKVPERVSDPARWKNKQDVASLWVCVCAFLYFCTCEKQIEFQTFGVTTFVRREWTEVLSSVRDLRLQLTSMMNR